MIMSWQHSVHTCPCILYIPLSQSIHWFQYSVKSIVSFSERPLQAIVGRKHIIVYIKAYLPSLCRNDTVVCWACHVYLRPDIIKPRSQFVLNKLVCKEPNLWYNWYVREKQEPQYYGCYVVVLLNEALAMTSQLASQLDYLSASLVDLWGPASN